tara:strand:- start:59 stop:616 length:558 start_codon:yes stop_codon:yes gene_type:complete
VKLKHYTLKPYQLESKHISQIHNIIENVVSKKKDEYWKNYTDYSIYDQNIITIGVINDEVKTFSSIYTREYYGDNVYRLLNRWLISDDIREKGGSKSYKGEHRFFDMIHQQIEFVKTLEPKFYFVSRQRKNTRWLKWYFDKFNKQYDANLVVSDEQYRVCNGSNYDCCQTLIYPKEMKIPFEKLL